MSISLRSRLFLVAEKQLFCQYMFLMETYRLKYFCTIAETGSLTKAAGILGVSHSGLSKAISTLQSETQLQLFQPQGRGLEITEQGKWFYKKAIEILKIENDILNGSQASKAAVRIGLSEVIAVTCAGTITEELTEFITIVEADVGEVENKIISNDIDFGFTFSPSPQIELDYLEIGKVKFNAYATSDYLKTVTKSNVNYVVPAHPAEFNPLGYKARDGWPQDLPRSTSLQVSSFAIAINIVRHSRSAVYMPDFVAELENVSRHEKSAMIKIPFHSEAQSARKLYLVKRKTFPESKEMKKVSKILRKTCCN